MNLAVGVDLVEVDRIEATFKRHPERFLGRHFTARERDQCGHDPQRLATRWAVKEATVKALGTGIGAIAWHDIEVICDELGAPTLTLSGSAQELAAAAGLDKWSVTMSHTSGHALAVVAAVGPGHGHSESEA